MAGAATVPCRRRAEGQPRPEPLIAKLRAAPRGQVENVTGSRSWRKDSGRDGRSLSGPGSLLPAEEEEEEDSEEEFNCILMIL